MTETPPHLYLKQGLASGVPRPVMEGARRQRQLNQQAGSLPILSLNHLARLSGVSLAYLREIVKRQSDPYQNIQLEKRGGGSRPISAPEPLLLEVQRVVLDRALNGAPLHVSAHAYRKNHSVVGCARQHTGARWLIKLDLHDFFGRIDERHAYRAFRSRLYSPLVSFELARLCTRLDPRAHIRDARLASLERRYTVIPEYPTGTLGRLPQGAPTSGALANMSAFSMDHEISEYVLNEGLVYTRYSDDLTFSTASDLHRSDAKRIVRDIGQLVQKHGHALHSKKTRIVPPGARHVVLGLLLDGDAVRLLPEFRRRVEVHVRGVSKFGLVEHSDHRDFRSVLSFVNHVEGCLAFALDVDREWSANMREQWNTALGLSGYPQ